MALDREGAYVQYLNAVFSEGQGRQQSPRGSRHSLRLATRGRRYSRVHAGVPQHVRGDGPSVTRFRE